MPKPKDSHDSGGLHKALSHPLRASILLSLEQEGTISPKRFTRRTAGSKEEVSLNVAAYHFRVLVDFGVIELVERIPRRGATEHVYRLNPNSPVPDMLRATSFLQQIMGAEERPLEPGTLNGTGESVTVLPLEVDEQGQKELEEMVLEVKAGLMEIARKCGRRLSKSKDKPIPMRIGLAAYQPDSQGATPPIRG